MIIFIDLNFFPIRPRNFSKNRISIKCVGEIEFSGVDLKSAFNSASIDVYKYVVYLGNAHAKIKFISNGVDRPRNQKWCLEKQNKYHHRVRQGRLF